MKKIIRAFFFLICVAFVGGLGGFFLPKEASQLSTLPLFSRFSFLRDFGYGVTVVRPVERIVVRNGEEKAKTLRYAQGLVGKAVLKDIREEALIAQTNGVFVTSDGGFLAYASSVLDRGVLSVAHNGNTIGATLLKVDTGAGLALLKTEGSGFPVASIRNDPVALGEELFFLFRTEYDKDTWQLRYTYVTTLGSDSLFTVDALASLPSYGGQELQGAPLFDKDGKLVGMLGFRSDRTPELITAPTIQKFLE